MVGLPLHRQSAVHDHSCGSGDHGGARACPVLAGNQSSCVPRQWATLLAFQQAELHWELLPEAEAGNVRLYPQGAGLVLPCLTTFRIGATRGRQCCWGGGGMASSCSRWCWCEATGGCSPLTPIFALEFRRGCSFLVSQHSSGSPRYERSKMSKEIWGYQMKRRQGHSGPLRGIEMK